MFAVFVCVFFFCQLAAGWRTQIGASLVLNGLMQTAVLHRCLHVQPWISSSLNFLTTTFVNSWHSFDGRWLMCIFVCCLKPIVQYHSRLWDPAAWRCAYKQLLAEQDESSCFSCNHQPNLIFEVMYFALEALTRDCVSPQSSLIKSVYIFSSLKQCH